MPCWEAKHSFSSYDFSFLCHLKQVWHLPREYYPVWTEYWHSTHSRPCITLWVCRRGSPLTSNIGHESGLSRHKENILLRRFPQVSFSSILWSLRCSCKHFIHRSKSFCCKLAFPYNPSTANRRVQLTFSFVNACLVKNKHLQQKNICRFRLMCGYHFYFVCLPFKCCHITQKNMTICYFSRLFFFF